MGHWATQTNTKQNKAHYMEPARAQWLAQSIQEAWTKDTQYVQVK